MNGYSHAPPLNYQPWCSFQTTYCQEAIAHNDIRRDMEGILCRELGGLLSALINFLKLHNTVKLKRSMPLSILNHTLRKCRHNEGLTLSGLQSVYT